MKYLFTLLLLLGISIGAIAQDADHVELVKAEKRAAAFKIQARGNTQARGFDVGHQRLDLQVDPAVNLVTGTVTTTFRVTQDSLTQVVLDLEDALTVDSITYQGNAVSFTHQGGKITINLPASLPLDAVAQVAIQYHGTPPGSGFGSFVQSDHNGAPIIWTLSEPYGADDWWPCKQDLVDKIDSLDVLVTVPSGNLVAGNGLLVEQTEQNGMATFHWKHRYPIPTYLVAFAVTNYVPYTDTVASDSGDIVMLNYVYPESLNSAQTGTANLVSVMQLYNDLFGVYPYWKEKYGHAQFGWGGGMEHTTMTFAVSFSHGLLSHELAHQWFGDAVTCGSWEDIWLNEGFATYLEGLTYEHGLGSADFSDWLVNKINTVISQPGGSVKVDDTTSVGRIFSWRLSYSKGAMVLHMLRWVLGDDAFFQGIRDYLNDPQLRFGFATTADLKAHLEAASGKDLTDFFDSWYSGEGYPIYSIIWEQTPDNVLHVNILQAQSVPASYFKMPVPLRAIGPGFSQDLVFQNDADDQYFTAQLPGPVTELQFDPDHWLVAEATITQGPVAVDPVPEQARLTVTPNPAWDRVRFSGEAGGLVIITDIAGRQLARLRKPRSTAVWWEPAGRPEGLYIWRLVQNGRVLDAGKLVIN